MSNGNVRLRTVTGIPQSAIPADPTTFVPTSDPFSELNQLIQNIASQRFSPPNQSRFEQITGAIAQAAAVLASPDPGGTLSGQLQQRQAIKLQREQAEQQRQQQLQGLQLQSALERARGLQTEQAEFRKEQRSLPLAREKAKIELDIFAKQEDVRINSAEKIARLNERIAAEFEPARLARSKNEAFIKDMPQMRKDKIEYAATAAYLFPNLNPFVVDSIAAKQVGLNQEPLTTEEADLVKKINQESSKLTKEEREVKIGKIKAETEREKAEAAYTRAGKPAQDRFMNAYQGALGRDAADAIDNRFWKLPDGRILSAKELNSIKVLDPDFDNKLRAVPLNEQENTIEMNKRVQKLIEARTIETQRKAEALETKGQEQILQGIPDKLVRTFELGKQKKYSDEQMRILLKANGATDEQINKLVPPKSPQSQKEAEKGQIPKTRLERVLDAIGGPASRGAPIIRP